MAALYLILGILLIAGPILIAAWKGDQILDGLSARRRRRRRRKRQNSTRALPVREEVLGTLIRAEEVRDACDDRIAEALAGFQHVVHVSPRSESSTASIDELEHILLAREAHFSSYLDIAWLQSEAIEVLLRELDLLLEMAQMHQMPEPGEATAPPSPAAERLLESLDRASRKREELDERLHRVGTPKPEETPPQRFDAIVT